MKKIIALLLALTLCVGLFAGCDLNNTKPNEAPATVDAAAEYLYAMYKENNNTVVRKDFKRVAVVMIDGIKFDVEWTVDSAEVTVGAVENSMVTIDINEAPVENVTFKLTATVKAADGTSKAVIFTHSIEAAKKTGVEFVAPPVAGTAYKFALEQVGLGQIRYFIGEMDGYYLGTSDNPFDAVDVFVEDVTGGQHIYFMKGDVKTYIDVIPREGAAGKVNVVMTENPTAVFTWDSVRKTFTTVVEGNTWYLGTYGTNKTISASNISYIEKPEVIGDTQFPAGPYIVEGFMDKEPEFKEETPDAPEVKDPAADSTLSVKDAIALGGSKEHNIYTTGKYYVVGEIIEISNTQYGNMKIKDAEGNTLTIYGTWSADGTLRFDAMPTQPKVGDTVKLYGIIGQYNGTPQLKNGWIIEIKAK